MRNINELQNKTSGTIRIIPFPKNQVEDFIADKMMQLLNPKFDNKQQMENYRDKRDNAVRESNAAINNYYLKAASGDTADFVGIISKDKNLAGFVPRFEDAPNTVLTKIAVRCETVDEVAAILSEFEAMGFATRYNASYYFDRLKHNTCFTLSNGFAYSSKAHYEKMGYEIVSALDFVSVEVSA